MSRSLEAAALSEALAARLERESCLSPLDIADAPLFGLFDLSSLVATRGGTDADPEQLMNTALQTHWRKRVAQGSWIDAPFELGRRPYWIVQAGKPIGTIAFMVKPYHPKQTIEISSVYVRREYRRQGWGSRILGLVTAAAFEVGVGCVVLETEWSAQNALRLYCSQGMWLRMWKDGIQLHIDRDQPRWHMELHGQEARFLVDKRVVGIARDRGRLLEWRLDETLEPELAFSLEMTAALQLALMRWPIIRTEELWQQQLRHGCGDCGSFESFALRMREFESEIRLLGWSLPADSNPSFEAFPHLLEVDVHAGDQLLLVRLSDGVRLEIPAVFLRYSFTNAGDMLESATIIDDEVKCTYQSGDKSSHSVDCLLHLEHEKSKPRSIVSIATDYTRRVD